MRELNPDYLEVAAREVNACPYFRLLSMDIMELEWGRCRLDIEVQEKHFQPFGVVHGGVFSSLVDATAFWAVYPQIDEHLGLTTVEIKLNYLEPATGGRMSAHGKSLRVGKTLCLGEASVLDERGRLLAHGTSTMMILRNFPIQGSGQWPRKFLEKGEGHDYVLPGETGGR